MPFEFNVKEWDYVATNGVEVLGRRHPTKPRTLLPVLHLIRPFMPDPNGGKYMGMSLQCLPFLSVGIPSLTYPEGALVCALEAFFAGNDRNWENLIGQGLIFNEQLRAQAAGVTLIRSPSDLTERH